MNFDLMTSGLLPVVIKAADRLAYYEALDKAHTGNDYQDFMALIIGVEIAALNKTLSLVSSK